MELLNWDMTYLRFADLLHQMNISLGSFRSRPAIFFSLAEDKLTEITQPQLGFR